MPKAVSIYFYNTLKPRFPKNPYIINRWGYTPNPNSLYSKCFYLKLIINHRPFQDEYS